MNAPAQQSSLAPESSASVGAEIRALRRARSMTLADLAQASGVSTSHLSAIERGAVNPLRISEIPDSDYANSRTAVSVNPGQLGHG